MHFIPGNEPDIRAIDEDYYFFATKKVVVKKNFWMVTNYQPI
jgi:hypothetical protein